MTMTPKQRYEQRLRDAIEMKGILSKKYKVSICDFDRTSLEVHCTQKQFFSICEQYGCSGHYSDKTNAAYITNFGVYK